MLSQISYDVKVVSRQFFTTASRPHNNSVRLGRRGEGGGTRRARLLCACVPLHCAPVDYEISGHPAATGAINHCRPFVTDTIGLSVPVPVYRTIDNRVPDKINREKNQQIAISADEQITGQGKG